VRKQHWAILFVLIALGGGTLWLFLGGAPVEEGRCRLVSEKADQYSEPVWLAVQVLQPLTVKPESVRDLPAGFDRPCYYEIKSGGKQISLVVNLSGGLRLCLDTNGDGVLSHQRCYGATLIRQGEWQFGPISPTSQDNAGEAEGGFYVTCGSTESPAPLITRPASLRTGKLKLDGRTYRVAVIDGDYDGRFRSILSLPLDQQWWLPKSDVFAIDLNRNGEFERSPSLSVPSEVMPLGTLVRVGDTYYALALAQDGTSLMLSKTQPQLGALVIEPNDTTAELKLWSDAADQCLRGRQWQLPAGKYLGTHAAFKKKDAAGNVWSFACDLNGGPAHYPLGPLKFFAIAPGQPTRLRVGPPFVVTTEVRKIGTELSIQLVLIGCGGERYQASVQRNGQRVPEPAFKIVDEEGTVLVADKFQYG
jgi:hypothetical protein